MPARIEGQFSVGVVNLAVEPLLVEGGSTLRMSAEAEQMFEYQALLPCFMRDVKDGRAAGPGTPSRRHVPRDTSVVVPTPSWPSAPLRRRLATSMRLFSRVSSAVVIRIERRGIVVLILEVVFLSQQVKVGTNPALRDRHAATERTFDPAIRSCPNPAVQLAIRDFSQGLKLDARPRWPFRRGAAVVHPWNTVNRSTTPGARRPAPIPRTGSEPAACRQARSQSATVTPPDGDAG